MKKISLKFLWLFIALLSLMPILQGIALEKIIFFWGQGCLHCAKVEKFIQENNLDMSFEIDRREIYFNKENREMFEKICDELQIPINKRGVPMAVINGKCIVGDKPIIDALKAKMKNLSIEKEENVDKSSSKKLTLPLVIGAASVDAINPCAFAVLIILMSTILASGKRKKVILAGLSFAVAIYISYLLMGLGIYKALATAKFSNWFIKGIGGLAVLIGLLNIKDYFWYGGGGFLMEVPLGWRPTMKSLIGSVTSPLGAFVVGFLVSLFLLPCTSGPYIVILGMLSQKETFFSALLWLLLYNAIFVLPMILITLAVYKGLNPQKAEEERQKRLRLLHLIAGILMVGMGIIILIKL